MSYTGFFLDTPYKVIDGNIVYAQDLNNPLAALSGGIASLVAAVQTGNTISTAPDTGSVNAYAATLTAAPESYTDGLMIWFKPAATNTGPSTLNINSLGAKPIRSSVRPELAGGELLAGFWFQLKYTATHEKFFIVSFHGGTDIDATKTITAGESIEITSNDTTVFVSVPDSGITTDKILDGAVTEDKLNVDLSDYSHYAVHGGDILRVGAREISISACECWDSTKTVWLKTTTDKTVTNPTGSSWAANVYYQLFEVRLVSDGSCEFRLYATEAAAAADTTIDAYRWRAVLPSDASSNLYDFYHDPGMDIIYFFPGVVVETGFAFGNKTLTIPFLRSRVPNITLTFPQAGDGTNASQYVGYMDSGRTKTIATVTEGNTGSATPVLAMHVNPLTNTVYATFTQNPYTSVSTASWGYEAIKLKV